VLASEGFSKSGALRNVSTPLELPIVNSESSAPPVMLNVSVWAGKSSSSAVTVVTDVWFSSTLTSAVAPPPSEVITGASFTSSTVTVMVCTSVVMPSETVTSRM